MKKQGLYLKTVREKLNISQVDFATKLGVKKQYLSAIENESKGLSKKIILQIKDLFGVNPNYLLMGEGEIFLKSPEESKVNPDLLSEIIKIAAEDPELVSYAIKTMNGDKKARDKFIKLTE